MASRESREERAFPPPSQRSPPHAIVSRSGSTRERREVCIDYERGKTGANGFRFEQRYLRK
jgi:hypothetical protein